MVIWFVNKTIILFKPPAHKHRPAHARSPLRMSGDDHFTVFNFNRAEVAFYKRHTETAQMLERRAQSVKDIVLKCARLVELEKLAENLVPPPEERIQHLVYEINTREKFIAERKFDPRWPNFTVLNTVHNLRNQHSALAQTPEKVHAREQIGMEIQKIKILLSTRDCFRIAEDLAPAIYLANITLPVLDRMPILNRTHATIAANAIFLLKREQTDIDKHAEKRSSYDARCARIHELRESSATTATLAAAIRATIPQEICAICLELISNSTTLNCKHVFHFRCILEWAAVSRSCPVCRARIGAEDLVLE